MHSVTLSADGDDEEREIDTSKIKNTKTTIASDQEYDTADDDDNEEEGAEEEEEESEEIEETPVKHKKLRRAKKYVSFLLTFHLICT
jgi:hypothetical protein